MPLTNANTWLVLPAPFVELKLFEDQFQEWRKVWFNGWLSIFSSVEHLSNINLKKLICMELLRTFFQMSFVFPFHLIRSTLRKVRSEWSNLHLNIVYVQSSPALRVDLLLEWVHTSVHVPVWCRIWPGHSTLVYCSYNRTTFDSSCTADPIRHFDHNGSRLPAAPEQRCDGTTWIFSGIDLKQQYRHFSYFRLKKESVYQQKLWQRIIKITWEDNYHHKNISLTIKIMEINAPGLISSRWVHINKPYDKKET